MEGDWTEICRFAYPVPISPQEPPHRIATVAFDTTQELLWVGTDRGQVVSFYPDAAQLQLRRYTSFKIQPADEGPVQQFLFNDKGILSLGARSLHLMMRRGLRIWSIRTDVMKDLRCMSFTSKGGAEVLVAGWQSVMLVVDANKGEITRQIPTERHYSIMKTSRMICAASHDGWVDFFRPQTFENAKSWQAHKAYIFDMDAQEDFVVTCGGAQKQADRQTRLVDAYVNVFDVKNMASRCPIPFPPLAARVRMHPRMQTTSIVFSKHGNMQIMDIMSPDTTNVRFRSVSPAVSMVEFAASGEAFAIVDSDCLLGLWGQPSKMSFVILPTPLEFPMPVGDNGGYAEWSDKTPLNSIGMPFYREPLLSAWAANTVSLVGQPVRGVDQATLARLSKTEWGYFGRRPRLRNSQVEEKGKAERVQVPKFLSDQAREQSVSGLEPPAEMETRNSIHSAAVNNQGLESLKAEAAAMYRTLEIKYSKFGVDDFDFGFYNKTSHAGLENHKPNAYANSLLQLFNYTPLIRNLALQHAASACMSDLCLLCELGYVFDMLQKAEGTPCQATNMLKTLSNYPSAGRSRILELQEDPREQSLSLMMQALTSFILDKIKQEYQNVKPASTSLEATLFGLERPVSPDAVFARILATHAIRSIQCSVCRIESKADVARLVTSLIYPVLFKQVARGACPPTVTFSQVVKTSMECELSLPKAWCVHCRRYQQMQQRQTIHSVPAVLVFNAALNDESKKLWSTPAWLPDEIGIIADRGQFFCFEGEDLRQLLERATHQVTVYSLMGLVASIEGGRTARPGAATGIGGKARSHLVGIVDVAHTDAAAPGESRWHLFNDFSVRPISSAEALTFNTTWKLPSTVIYQVKMASNRVNMEWKSKLDTSILYQQREHNFSPEPKTYQVLDPRTEAPGPATIVALDTEFVSLKQPEIQINSDGEKETVRPMSHALARVSVVRGQGEREGIPFIDDYITIRETIVDYLTLYSGITPGDLDPKSSRHNLVSLKATYKKLWVLLNLGCKFLGHGLKQDFRVINMQVPKSQIIDTFDLFYLKQLRRRLSLAFLAWCLLKENIQLETHDSIEDARTALKLHRKYLEFQDAGVLDPMLQDIYKTGRDTNYKPPSKDDQIIQRTDTPPMAMDGLGPVPGPTTPARSSSSGPSVGSTQRALSFMATTPGKRSPLKSE